MTKKQQAKLLTEIMQADAKDGLYSDISKMETTEPVTNIHGLTAVEWLVQQFPIRMQNYIQKDVEIAKQMEKEKIIKAYGDGWKNGSLKKSPSFGYDYYIKTYNK